MCAAETHRWVWFVIPAVIGTSVIGAAAYQTVMIARQASYRTETRCHLKIIGLAMYNFHERTGTFRRRMSSRTRPSIRG